MNLDSLLPVLVLATSLVTALLIFPLSEENHRLRTIFNLFGAIAKLVFIGFMLWGVFNQAPGAEYTYMTRIPIVQGLDLVLHADALAMLFMSLSAILWLVTTIYAIGYLEEAPHRSRFFGFFSLCVASTMGISMAGNLFTFFVFYELLTLSTYPLVAHKGSDKAIKAGNVYLAYTIAGSAVLLVGIVWLYSIAGAQDFTQTGYLSSVGEEHHASLMIIFVMLIFGFGVKAALFPFHGWLPKAMVAPAPVSALLHAVAVVKAGAFGIIRVVYDVFGVVFAHELGVLVILTVFSAFTIVYGSVLAVFQDGLKKRLAYSTVSQVSYIALGVSLFGPVGTVGGIAHLVHQGVMKITLFFCAGTLAETLGIHNVSEMKGVGRRMPLTMTAFTIGAFGMIGLPPLAGFVSKWYLGLGALEAGMGWVILVLIASSVLNAIYFLPILYMAWFQKAEQPWAQERIYGRYETALMLLVPALVTAALSVLLGLFANAPFSPLEWAELITEREYRSLLPE